MRSSLFKRIILSLSSQWPESPISRGYSRLTVPVSCLLYPISYFFSDVPDLLFPFSNLPSTAVFTHSNILISFLDKKKDSSRPTSTLWPYIKNQLLYLDRHPLTVSSVSTPSYLPVLRPRFVVHSLDRTYPLPWMKETLLSLLPLTECTHFLPFVLPPLSFFVVLPYARSPKTKESLPPRPPTQLWTYWRLFVVSFGWFPFLPPRTSRYTSSVRRRDHHR